MSVIEIQWVCSSSYIFEIKIYSKYLKLICLPNNLRELGKAADDDCSNWYHSKF